VSGCIELFDTQRNARKDPASWLGQGSPRMTGTRCKPRHDLIGYYISSRRVTMILPRNTQQVFRTISRLSTKWKSIPLMHPAGSPSTCFLRMTVFFSGQWIQVS